MTDRGENYDGCICKNGTVHPDCPKHWREAKQEEEEDE